VAASDVGAYSRGII